MSVTSFKERACLTVARPTWTNRTSRVPQGSLLLPTYRDSQFEDPGLLDGQKQPDHDPEEKVEDAADDASQSGVVQAPLVKDGIVVEERSVADSDGHQDAQRCAMSEVAPLVAGPLFQHDHFSFALLVQKRVEPARSSVTEKSHL
jgi:hypothetical protein